MRRLFDRLWAFRLWRNVLAVAAGIQITRVTVSTAVDILAAPQANRTRIVPIGGLCAHNANTNDAETVDIKLDDNGTVRIVYTMLLTTFIPDTEDVNPCVIVLQPNQKLQAHVRSAVEDGINFHVSFLEHRPST